MRSRSSAALAALLLLAPALPLPAEAAEHAAREDDTAKAKALFKRARHAYDLGQFEDALRDYQAAYDLKQVPAILFNIAQCHRKLGHDERAGFFFQRFLDLAPSSENAATARELLAESRAHQAAAEQAAAEQARTREAKARADADAAAARRAEAELQARRAAEAEEARKLTASSSPPPPAPTPVYRRWYVWAGVGAAVVAGGAATYFLTTSPRPAAGSLGTVDAR